jgi:hypothetical protein
MKDWFDLYAQNHRRQQLMLAGGLALVLLFGAPLRNERALFFNAGAGPTAFAAVVPQQTALVAVVPNVAGARRTSPSLLAPGPGTPEPSFANPGIPSAPELGQGTEQLPLSIADPLVGGQPPNLAQPVDSSASSGGLPQSPQNASPVGTVPTTTTGGTTTSGGSSSGGSNPGVGPVPEPATWALLILGFFTVGFALRRRRAPAVRSSGVRP